MPINKNKLFLCSFIIVMMFVSNAGYSNEYDEAYRKKSSARLVDRFCSSSKVLKYINRDNSNCKKYISVKAMKCMQYVAPIIPAITTHDEAMKNVENVMKINRLFVYCVQTKIFEDIEKINFFE